MALRWLHTPFEKLSVQQLHMAYQLRQRVFVIEQDCPYLDADAKDLAAIHSLGVDAKGLLQAYCRLLPPGVSYDESSIGRVVVAPEARQFGYGQALMKEAMQQCLLRWPTSSVRISAQQYLARFYQSLGFETVSEPYDEDGIPHIEMLYHAH